MHAVENASANRADTPSDTTIDRREDATAHPSRYTLKVYLVADSCTDYDQWSRHATYGTRTEGGVCAAGGRTTSYIDAPRGTRLQRCPAITTLHHS